MQIIVKEIKVFSFNELSEKAKQNAIESYRNNEYYPYECWYDFVQEDFHTILKMIGFYNIESCFRGFCSQGDGASFTANYVYKKGCLNAIKEYAPNDNELHSIVKGIISHQKDYAYKLECSITKYSSLYCHSNTMSFDWNMKNSYDINWKNDFVENEINRLIKDLADWYYSKLNNEYDWLLSDECIIDNIISNDYQFLENGVQYF